MNYRFIDDKYRFGDWLK